MPITQYKNNIYSMAIVKRRTITIENLYFRTSTEETFIPVGATNYFIIIIIMYFLFMRVNI